MIIYVKSLPWDCTLLCKSQDLIRAYTLVSDRIIIPESATVINHENKKIRSKNYTICGCFTLSDPREHHQLLRHILSYMKGDLAVWLLLELHIKVYVELYYLSFHFADATKQIFKFSTREVLGTSLVGSELVEDLQES